MATSSDSWDRAVFRLSLAAGCVVFLLRLTAFNGFENDHFMHVAWAQQLALGAWPGRDFAEPGMPLAIVLSALAQVVWPGFLSEAVIGTALIGVAAGLACAVSARLTRALWAGPLASLIVLALYPRLYSYPKILVPAVAAWLVWRYVEHRRPGRLWALAAWAVAAFLLRHDLGVMTATAVIAALLLDRGQSIGLRLRASARFVGMGFALVAPYLAYLQWAEGVAEHVRVGAEFGASDTHQFLWSGPLPWLQGGHVDAGAMADAAEGVLFWAFAALVVTLGWWSLRAADAGVRSTLTALFVFALNYRLIILRYPLRARLPDVASVAAIGAAVALAAAVAFVVRSRHRSPVLSGVAGVAALLVVAAMAVSVWTVANLGDRLSQAGFERGPVGVAITLRDVVRRAPERSWTPFWPAGDMPDVFGELARCTTPDDRLLVTWFAPEYPVFAGRGFAAGHAYFIPNSFTTARDQSFMLDRLARESVPVAFVNETEHVDFSRAFPRVARYLADHYTIRGRFMHNDDTVIGVAVRNGATRCAFDLGPVR